MSYLREPSDPRVRELNVALEKAREDAQYWHDLARIATEETDALKDRHEAQQKDCDSWRARALKATSLNLTIIQRISLCLTFCCTALFQWAFQSLSCLPRPMPPVLIGLLN